MPKPGGANPHPSHEAPASGSTGAVVVSPATWKVAGQQAELVWVAMPIRQGSKL